jgi:hypothetical protein
VWMMGVVGELTRPRTIGGGGGVMMCTSRDVCEMGLWLIVTSGELSSTHGDKGMNGCARECC